MNWTKSCKRRNSLGKGAGWAAVELFADRLVEMASGRRPVYTGDAALPVKPGNLMGKGTVQHSPKTMEVLKN